jgi:leader peptidase (prepilin peptidase)/N-methyltransferase
LPDWLLPLLLAPFIGSFAALLIRRLPANRPVVLGRSQCEACGHALGARDLVPLVSVALLGGRCRWCGARIAVTHLAVELACLAIAVWAVARQAGPADADGLLIWLDCVLGWTLLTLAWIDWDHMLLPDALTLPLILAGLGATLLVDPGATTEHAAAAAGGYLAFRAIEIGYHRLRGRDGLGQGDAKLMAAAGAWLGVAPLPTVVFMAAVFGLAIAAGQRIAGQAMHRHAAIPFGPALCAAIWVAWLGYDPILLLADRLP